MAGSNGKRKALAMKLLRRLRNNKRLARRWIRARRSHYPIHRRRRYYRRRRAVPRGLSRICARNYNKPILVQFFTTSELKIDTDDYNQSLYFSMISFNDQQIRQQLYGYTELFDQFKIVEQRVTMHFKTTAEWTDINTNIPEVFWVYDYDLKGRHIDIFNIQKLQNVHHKLMPPLTKLTLRLVPRWTDNRLVVKYKDAETQYLDTQSGIRKVDNPWLDTDILKSNRGQAPDVDSINGWAMCAKNCNKRVLVLHNYIYVSFRGRKNNQDYVVPT